MNRRRFLSLIGMLPAAMALPHALGQASKMERSVDAAFAIRPAVTSLAQDFKYSQLVMAHGGETILPMQSRTPLERALDAASRYRQAYVDLAKAETELGFYR